MGEQCNEYLGLFCADQSSICVNGYCQCIPPMVEQQGQCQMPLVRESGKNYFWVNKMRRI